MTIKRWDAKRDLAEKEIVEYLRARGCSVYRLDQPVDLLVGLQSSECGWVNVYCSPKLIWVLCEVKTGNGDLTKPQIKFIEDNAGFPIHILRGKKDVDEMLSFYGVT